MTHTDTPVPLLDRACRYAELLGRIHGWLDLNQQDPNYFSADKALTAIRRLVDQFDTEHADTPDGDRP